MDPPTWTLARLPGPKQGQIRGRSPDPVASTIAVATRVTSRPAQIRVTQLHRLDQRCDESLRARCRMPRFGARHFHSTTRRRVWSASNGAFFAYLERLENHLRISLVRCLVPKCAQDGFAFAQPSCACCGSFQLS